MANLITKWLLYCWFMSSHFCLEIDNEALHLIYGNFAVLLNDLNWFCTHAENPQSSTHPSLTEKWLKYGEWANRLIFLSKKVIKKFSPFLDCSISEKISQWTGTLSFQLLKLIANNYLITISSNMWLFSARFNPR